MAFAVMMLDSPRDAFIAADIMTSIAIITCAADAPVLNTTLAAHLAGLLPQSLPPVWLKHGVAFEITFDGGAAERECLLTLLRETLAALPADVNILPAESRRKKLLVADMDSTMIEQECIDELADLAGLKPHIAAITERAMRGDIAFEPALRERVALLKGLPLASIAQLLKERISLTPGGRTLVTTMRAHGAYAALVSGGFTAFTQPIGQEIGFDEDRGNVLDIEDERLLGTVQEPILGQDAKRAALIELREKLGLQTGETLAVGDGANDLAMLDEAGLGVAFRAKPHVAAKADARIDHGDLTALLYLQGYAEKDFAKA